jgi:hypothetical protein
VIVWLAFVAVEYTDAVTRKVASVALRNAMGNAVPEPALAATGGTLNSLVVHELPPFVVCDTMTTGGVGPVEKSVSQPFAGDRKTIPPCGVPSGGAGKRFHELPESVVRYIAVGRGPATGDPPTNNQPFEGLCMNSFIVSTPTPSCVVTTARRHSVPPSFDA